MATWKWLPGELSASYYNHIVTCLYFVVCVVVVLFLLTLLAKVISVAWRPLKQMCDKYKKYKRFLRKHENKKYAAVISFINFNNSILPALNVKSNQIKFICKHKIWESTQMINKKLNKLEQEVQTGMQAGLTGRETALTWAPQKKKNVAYILHISTCWFQLIF